MPWIWRRCFARRAKRLRRQTGARGLGFGRDRIQEGWRRGAHGLAVDGTRAKIYVGKPLGLVSSEPGPTPSKPGHWPCFFNGNWLRQRAAGCGYRDGDTMGCAEVLSLPAKAWYGRAGRSVKVIEYYDTENRTLLGLTPHGLNSGGHLWGTSHMHFRSCDKLKNLTFCIEPHPNPTRPNLRDGH